MRGYRPRRAGSTAARVATERSPRVVHVVPQFAVPTCLQTLSPGQPGDDFYEAAKESTDAYNDGCRAGGSIDVDGAADESGAATACAAELPASYAGTIMSRAWVNGCLHALGVPDADAPHLLDQL